MSELYVESTAYKIWRFSSEESLKDLRNDCTTSEFLWCNVWRRVEKAGLHFRNIRRQHSRHKLYHHPDEMDCPTGTPETNTLQQLHWQRSVSRTGSKRGRIYQVCVAITDEAFTTITSNFQKKGRNFYEISRLWLTRVRGGLRDIWLSTANVIKLYQLLCPCPFSRQGLVNV